ncbi:hypothetical protein [Gemmata sp.]|uniref:hypothetical protein n=1 Tax=Gemmata sp. TaxID=1914242 RepID=UPI003F6FABDD
MTPTAPAGEGAVPACDDPPSLRRRGPARLYLRLRNGNTPRIARGRVHVRAGRTLIVTVTPPTLEARVEISSAPGLYTEVSPTRVAAGPVSEYHAEYAGHFYKLSLPWPYTVKLCVAVLDGRPNPYRAMVPVTVWPSLGRLVTWWLAVSVGVLGIRWQNALAQSASVGSVFTQVADDLSFAGGVLLLGVPVLGVLQALWLLMTLRPPEDT